MYENKLYCGIVNVLKELNNKAINCIIATSKPETFANRILEYFHINNYFKYVAGSNLDGTLSEKEEIIKYIIEKYQLRKNKTIMVGDRKYDIIGAHKNAIDAVGVLYGYGTKEELEKENPKYLCTHVEDLLKIIV
jgi:phosphoglycolate phosphatase